MKNIILFLFLLNVNLSAFAAEQHPVADSTLQNLIHEINTNFLYEIFENYQEEDYFTKAEFVYEEKKLHRRNVLLTSIMLDSLMLVKDRQLAQKVFDMHRVNLQLLDLNKEVHDSIYSLCYDSLKSDLYAKRLVDLKALDFNATNSFIDTALNDLNRYRLHAISLQNDLDKFQLLLAEVSDFDTQIIHKLNALKVKYNHNSKYVFFNNTIDEIILQKKITGKVYLKTSPYLETKETKSITQIDN